MKTALYIDAGRTQVVLTAENGFDKGIIGRLQKHRGTIRVERGEFYSCRGGWTRHAVSPGPYSPGNQEPMDSLFIILDDPVADQPPSPSP